MAMGKKADDADVKKECPSCGLGVALDAKICEFCGWDFNEGDEWILQIEKLERDLKLEKMKSEPGSVGSKIESSLHIPAAVKKEQLKASAAKARLQKEMEEVLGAPEQKRAEEPEAQRPAPPPATRLQKTVPATAPMKAVIREAKPIEAPSLAVEKEPQTQEGPPEQTAAPAGPGKVRRVRKVKGESTSTATVAQPTKSRPVKKAG